MHRHPNGDISTSGYLALVACIVLVIVAGIDGIWQDKSARIDPLQAAMAETQISTMSQRVGDLIDQIDRRGYANEVGDAYLALKRDRETLNNALAVQDPAQSAQVLQNVRAGLNETTYSIFWQSFFRSWWSYVAAAAFVLCLTLWAAFEWDQRHYWPWEERRKTAA